MKFIEIVNLFSTRYRQGNRISDLADLQNLSVEKILLDSRNGTEE